MTPNNQKMKKTGLKVASVIMSILLWFYVVNQGGVAAGRDLLEVALKYNNLPADLTVTGPEKVSVRLWGSLHGATNIVAYVDLSGLGKGVHKIPVKLEPVKGALFTSVKPDKVEVTMEELTAKTFQVKQEVKQNPQAGYQLTQVLLTPDRCIIKGDAETVGLVALVTAPLDLSKVKDVTTLKINLQARDANGKIISDGLKLIPAVIDASVVVEKMQINKKVGIKPQFTGKLPDGFTQGEVKTDPVQVSILGDQLRVENITEILTTPVDLNGKQEDFVQVVELSPPEGVTVAPTRITMNVKISRIVDKGVR